MAYTLTQEDMDELYKLAREEWYEKGKTLKPGYHITYDGGELDFVLIEEEEEEGGT